MALGRSTWEGVKAAVKSAVTSKPKAYSEKTEKESTVDQIKRDKGATNKALKEAGAE